MVERLEALIGEWSMEVSLPGAPPGDSGCEGLVEWMPGRQFVVQRWVVPVPEAPDGLAVLGFNEPRDSFLQRCFDSRGVARVYEMSIGDGTWKLWRDSEDSRRSGSRSATSARSARTARPSRALGRSPTTARAGSTTST